jgi:hypothetical protein
MKPNVNLCNNKEKTIMFTSCVRNLDKLISFIAVSVDYSVYLCV